jgi:hypothetical protein
MVATVVTGLLGAWAAPAGAKPRAPRPVVVKVPVPDAGNASLGQFRYRIRGLAAARAQPKPRIKLKVLNGRRLPSGVTVAGAAGTMTVKGHLDIVLTLAVGRRKPAGGRSARLAPSSVEVQVTATPRLLVSADGSVVKRNVVKSRRASLAGFGGPAWSMPEDGMNAGYLYGPSRNTPAGIFLKGLYDLYIGRPSREADAVLELLNLTTAYTLTGTLGCRPFSAYEMECFGRLAGRYPPSRAYPADTRNPLDAIKVVMPDRAVTNHLCPTQLPRGTVSTTAVANDTLTCDGGTLPLDQDFKLNIRTNPPPATGMGGKLYGRQDGVFRGPFAITGP